MDTNEPRADDESGLQQEPVEQPRSPEEHEGDHEAPPPEPRVVRVRDREWCFLALGLVAGAEERRT
jgi:hypothetical protein